MVLSGAMFSFDKLNRAVGSFNRVPLIAEFMVTKWGYEGLVVHQFKDNAFHKTFYDIEKTERNASYKTIYYIPELEKKLNASIDALAKKDDVKFKNKLSDNLAVLQKALFNETNYMAPAIPYRYLQNLNVNSFSEEAAYATIDYLEDLKAHYDKIYQSTNQKRDRIVNHLVNTNAQLYEGKRQAYHNESIADLVMKTFEKNKILQYKDELVQQTDPIYRDPIPNHFLDYRSHFFAPRKYFMGTYFDTFWFNICFIWFMSVILYLTLYYESLKWALELFGKIRLPKFRK
jgi:hypothetical protein